MPDADQTAPAGSSKDKENSPETAGKQTGRTDTSAAKPKKREKTSASREKASIGKDVQDTDESMPRRRFFSWLSVAWLAFAGATAAFLTMMARFMFPNVLFEPAQTFKAGFPDEYSIGAVDTRWKEAYGVWIIRTSQSITALSTVCTHLGCTPNWLETDRKFKCPCHGSGFKMSGMNFEGPAPRPLERYRIVLAEDGQILIDKTKRYQQEKGQWSDPESFLVV